MYIFIKNATLLIFLIGGQMLFAQSESINYKTYSISLQQEGIPGYERLKIEGEEAKQFDISAYIHEHISDYTVSIWATEKTENTQSQYRFNSKELMENRDCKHFQEKLLSIERQALLGVSAIDHEEFEGAIVASVVTNSAAEAAGIIADDLITFIGETSIHSSCELKIAIRKYNVGDEVPVTFVRNGVTKIVNAELGYKLVKKMTWVPSCGTSPEGFELPQVVATETGNSQLKLFPNPSKGASHIRFSSDVKESIQILVTDVNGRRVFNQEFDSFDGLVEQYLDLTDAAAGVFFVTVVQGEAVFMERLVVVKE